MRSRHLHLFLFLPLVGLALASQPALAADETHVYGIANFDGAG